MRRESLRGEAYEAFTGGAVYFRSAEFSGGVIDFSRPGDWSFPPAFTWTGTPPFSVKLPGPRPAPPLTEVHYLLEARLTDRAAVASALTC
jgi:hypothetical protein